MTPKALFLHDLSRLVEGQLRRTKVPFFVPAVLLLLSWGVLSFGAVYPWGYVPLLVGCAELGLYGLFRTGAFRGVPVALVGSLGAIAVAISLQLVPLSPPALAWVSPANEALMASANPVPAAPSAAIGVASPPSGQTGAARPISTGSQSTVLALVSFVVYGLFFLGCARALSAVGADGVARGLTALGTLVALIVVIHVAGPGDTIYGFWQPQHSTRPFAPFVNKNHLAGWMIMVLSLSIGLFGAGVAGAARGVKSGWRNRTLWLSSRAAGQLVLVAFSVVLMALSLVLAMSNSGITCLAFALVALGWFVVRKQATASRRLLASGYLVFVLIVAVGWVGIDTVGQRFYAASWATASGRLGIWIDTMHIVQDFPLTGTGLGTWPVAILEYQTEDGTYLQAHSDYLQLAAEGGLLLGLPIAIAIFFFVREVRRRFRARVEDTQTYWLRAGAVTGLIASALQEVVEFSLQNAGTAALFAVLAAIAIHQPTRSHGRRERPEPARS